VSARICPHGGSRRASPCALLASAEDAKEQVLATLQDWLSTPELAKDITLQVIAAQIYLAHGNLKAALQIASKDADNLEK
jgi:hypothetical protein